MAVAKTVAAGQREIDESEPGTFCDGAVLACSDVSQQKGVTEQESTERMVMSAAAGLGMSAGLLLGGPVSGAALGIAVAYATTREDRVGSTARKAGMASLYVSDVTLEQGMQLANHAVVCGTKQLVAGIEHKSVPPVVRRGVKNLLADSKPARGTLGDDARKIRQEHPDKVPVIVERSAYSDLVDLGRKKYLLPATMPIGEFKYIVHKHVTSAMTGHLASEQTIYIFVNGVTPKTSATLASVYEAHQADDGFLYFRYCAENTLG